MIEYIRCAVIAILVLIGVATIIGVLYGGSCSNNIVEDYIEVSGDGRVTGFQDLGPMSKDIGGAGQIYYKSSSWTNSTHMDDDTQFSVKSTPGKEGLSLYRMETEAFGRDASSMVWYSQMSESNIWTRANSTPNWLKTWIDSSGTGNVWMNYWNRDGNKPVASGNTWIRGNSTIQRYLEFNWNQTIKNAEDWIPCLDYLPENGKVSEKKSTNVKDLA